MKKVLIFFIFFFILVHINYSGPILTKNPDTAFNIAKSNQVKELELYSWEDQKIAPLECVEKCKNSEFAYKIVKKNKEYILPSECKAICFSSQTTEQVQVRQIQQEQNKIAQKTEGTDMAISEKAQEKNQLKNEVKNQFREEIQQITQNKKELENQSEQKNEIKELVIQKNQELKQIQNEFKESVQQKVQIRIKNTTKEVEIDKQKNELNFSYKNFKISLKNATVENNQIKVNNKTILLPEELNVEGQIKEMKIIQNQNKVLYQIKTQNSGKLLGIFQIEYEEEKEIDATSNTQKTISSPWWKILIFK